VQRPGSQNGLRLLDQRLYADPNRVVLRPFHLGWQSTHAPHDRSQRLVNNVLALSERSAATEYRRVLKDFGERHWQTEKMFDQRFAELAVTLKLNVSTISQSRKRLIGAYFCHEYTYAAAALMNPSIVPHPDQSGTSQDACRFIMSLRAVGEGHISSIAFREGIAYADGRFDLWPQSAYATAVQCCDDDPIDQWNAVTVRRQPDSNLSNTVIFPITEEQRGGLEDLRMVRFEQEDGTLEWIGTYTAYSGSVIRSELLRTTDFSSFQLQPIIGAAGRNKGMALFPRQIDGDYVMVGRQDGKNLYLLRSRNLSVWDDDGVLLMEPRYPWEFIQIGNCGSPIETEAGWLLLTHGVGAMRKYALGCVLLDRQNPSKIIGRLREPLLTAEDADRAGYVPNVIYTCGALRVGDRLHIPYGISDSSVGFATIAINDILASLI
jgi:predicted GH43/DUF377 family glycosyl hydrolase